MQLPRLKEWREFRGLTQPELAERAGLSLRTVFNYEHEGNALPNNARKLAEALGIEVGDLISEEAHPKGSAPLSQPNFNHLLAEERRTHEISQEIEHLREHVVSTLDRWEKVARGEDPTLRIDYTYSIEVWMQTASLMEWLAKLMPEASMREQRLIIGLNDELYKVATEINAIANANEGITPEAVDEEARALIDAEVAAIVSEQNPDDELAAYRRKQAKARYAEQAAQTAQQQANKVRRLAPGG